LPQKFLHLFNQRFLNNRTQPLQARISEAVTRAVRIIGKLPVCLADPHWAKRAPDHHEIHWIFAS